jgi:hypothetical protein
MTTNQEDFMLPPGHQAVTNTQQTLTTMFGAPAPTETPEQMRLL